MECKAIGAITVAILQAFFRRAKVIHLCRSLVTVRGFKVDQLLMITSRIAYQVDQKLVPDAKYMNLFILLKYKK